MKNIITIFRFIILILLLWFGPISVFAYSTCQTSGGTDIKWNTSSVTYYINTSGGPFGSASAIQEGMNTWTNSSANFTFSYGGSTTSSSHGSNDGINIVTFGALSSSSTLAVNNYWYYTSSGNMIDSDIRFNTTHSWGTSGSAGIYDIQNIGTHEHGHTLCLADLYSSADTEKTMYGYGATGETKKRTLHADDLAGITYLYPEASCANFRSLASEVPAEGPLTQEQIDDLPPPSEDTSALDEQLKAEIARIEADAEAKGLHLASPPVDKIEAGVAFRESLTEAQRQSIGKAFAQHENELKALMVPVEAALEDNGQPGAELLRSLEERLVTWQAALDSDIEKVLTKEQIDLYRWSQPTVPKLDVTASDLEALGLEVPEADEETESLADVCTDCEYTYFYGYYAYVYQYYAYLYAYYGYSSTGSSYAYESLIYNYYAYYYAEYVYIYGDYAYTYCPNSTYASYAYYYSNYALWYSEYGYVYSYYAYYYSGDSYLYYAYLYAYEGWTYSTYANIYAADCNC